MKRNKLLLLLVLLMTAVTGAWATDYTTLAVGDVIKVGDTFTPTDDGVFNNNGVSSGNTYSLMRADIDNDYNVTEKTDGAYYVFKFVSEMSSPYIHFEKAFAVTAISDGLVVTNIETKKGKLFYTLAVHGSAAPAPTGYTVSLADGTEDADNWTITPKQGLSEGDQVTITYTGSKRVKSVKAVKEDPSVTKVTTFSELQTALSAGKNVKLKNDIVCTAEIEISSDGALTIDGNGKKLSTTSAIRAFTVKSSATVAFKNLTLTGFVSGGGPAINNSGTIVLDGCTISNCHVNNSNGGGAIESSGKLYAINTTFSGNYSGEIGGAINNAWGSLYMIGCTFTNNYTTSSNAYYGGAIGINRGNEVRLINCVFSENKYGTNTGTNDIGVFNNPTNYTIAGCTGATIASRNGDITTIASGTATLDYSDLSNISFTYTPVTVTLTTGEIGDLSSWGSTSKTINGITIAVSGDAHFFITGYMEVSAYDPDTADPIPGDGTYTFTSSVGNIKRIDINHNAGKWWGSGAGWPGSYNVSHSSTFTWSGTPAASVTLNGSCNEEDQCAFDVSSFVFTIEPTN